MKKILFIAIILATFAPAFVLRAQSIETNPDFQKAIEYQKMAEDALDKGDYDKAYEYALEAEKYSKSAKDYADNMLLKFHANSLIAYLQNEFSVLDKEKAKENSPDDYNNAVNDFDHAKSSYDGGNYQDSIDYSNKTKEDLDNLRTILAGGAKPTTEPEATAEPELTQEPEQTTEPTTEPGTVFPKYYKVQRNPKNRDCLWTIAGYSYVFNDPFKWRLLYEANKSKLVDPKNPRLILPDQTLEIPSISGETRDGTYAPGKEYPTLPKE
jgi:tetratricopeptide (TPR) repeat protein